MRFLTFDDERELDMLAAKDTGIGKAVEMLKYMSKDETTFMIKQKLSQNTVILPLRFSEPSPRVLGYPCPFRISGQNTSRPFHVLAEDLDYFRDILGDLSVPEGVGKPEHLCKTVTEKLK
jgi:hypothetical protein